jgi:hypothetical protein
MTGSEIQNILYDGMKALLEADRASEHPALMPPLSGKVYRKGHRPEQSGQPQRDKEDIVVAVIAGNDEQIQKGSCLVNVYIPDTLTTSGAYHQSRRTEMAERWLKGVPKALSRMGDVSFKRSAMILTLEKAEIHQHYASLKMDFKLLNPDY